MKRIDLYKHVFFSIGLSMLFPMLMQGQSTILETYVKSGLENNLTLKQEQFNINKSLKALQEAESLFRPNITFNASYSVAAGGRAIDFPIGDLLNPVYSTLNALTQTNQFPTIENEQINFLPHNFQETKVRLIQPIFNMDIYYNKKAKTALISVQEAKKEVYEQELTKDIKTAYYQYLQTLEVLKILDETEKLLKEILRTNEKLVKNNIATRDVIYTAKYEIENLKNERTKAEEKTIMAKAYFNFLLNKPLTEEILEDEKIEISKNMQSVNSHTAKALNNRKEFEQLKSVMNVNQQAIYMKEAQALPQVAFVMDAGFQGTGYHFLDNQAFVFGSLNLTWNIYDGKQRKSQLEQIKIDQAALSNQYAQVEKQIELQVKGAYEALKTAEQTVETSKAALVNAKEGFRLIKKQYENGKTFFYQLIQARTNLTNAKIALSIAEFDVLVKEVALDYAKGF